MAEFCSKLRRLALDTYLPISFLNDFIFCPRSIYFAQIYRQFDDSFYRDRPQYEGKMAHATIDKKKYSNRKNIFQSLNVFSEKYNLYGKVDLFDQGQKKLIERKKNIKKIYDGYVFQIYAQYYCLTEMGYNVEYLVIYDLDNNKNYEILRPEIDFEMNNKFANLIMDINNFDISKQPVSLNKEKCINCIYNNLCDYSLC